MGNGCIDRTANFIHPGLLGQGQEIGRDQGHASLDIAELAPFCQMAWNQGVDLYGYENNRVLSVAEYTAKYNLFYDVPFVPYYCSTSGLMNGPSGDSRGAISRPGWATIYNHYVNLKGLAAPYTQTAVNQDGAGYESGGYTFNGDEPEWDYLTSALPPIATGANPSGLTAIVTAPAAGALLVGIGLCHELQRPALHHQRRALHDHRQWHNDQYLHRHLRRRGHDLLLCRQRHACQRHDGQFQ